MPTMIPCPECAQHVMLNACGCPHCGVTLRECNKLGRVTASAALLGLALVGCGDKDGGDSAINVQPEYGVFDSGMFLDEDGDGFTEEDGDCDDSDAAINPEATETAGDGVDSNCDGNDDS